MIVLTVDVYVLPKHMEAFTTAMLTQAKAAQQEAGNVRYDVIQDEEDPHHFVLHEAYRDQEAFVKHREAAHTQTWKTAVEPFMARPRTRTRGKAIFYGDEQVS